MNPELKTYLAQKQETVNQALLKVLSAFDPDRELVQAMKHSLMAGGKRLRPVLALASAGACGKDDSPALPVSCALEMIHTYSLIHDDLPAMDDDDLRRGVPTCHKQFSEATAILAGDALLTHAFFVLASPEELFSSYPDAVARIKLSAMLAQAAGVQGMVEGQMMDMQSFDGQASTALSHLEKIHTLKTGKMIRVSVKAGAVSVGAPDRHIMALTGYAEKIGLAFQVVDDILNIEGNPEVMGKAKGSDALNDKMTFPAIIGLDASKKYAGELVHDAVDCLGGFNEIDAAPLKMIAQYIINRDR